MICNTYKNKQQHIPLGTVIDGCRLYFNGNDNNDWLYAFSRAICKVTARDNRCLRD